ncbi:MAG TPA: CBS domain-containing protein [Vicinamibacteria bacterium]|nr:CBS domain-containing protein [Vicinamibacteria bacterium]
MKVKDVMTMSVECVRPETTLQEAAAKMKSLNVGSLPVCESDRPIGIVTDRDIVIRAIAEGRDPRTGRVPEVMTADVVSVPNMADVKAAARLMRDRQIRRIVVVDSDQRVVGIVSLGDIAVDTRDYKMSGDVLEKVSKDAVTVGNR